MHAFAQLLEQLLLAPGRQRKIMLLVDYFNVTTDPERGYALAALAGTLRVPAMTPSFFKARLLERVDATLLRLSHDYVGDLAETIALLWPEETPGSIPNLPTLIETLRVSTEPGPIIDSLFARSDVTTRWACIKLFTGHLRVGVSARLAKLALAVWSGQEVSEIEQIWHGCHPPYSALFAWLSGLAPKPLIDPLACFHPMMLADTLVPEQDLSGLRATDYCAEWKWDGIRVQLALRDGATRLFSRSGDDISHSFPDLLSGLTGQVVLDGELLVGTADRPLPFQVLQQRLQRKQVTRALIEKAPAFIQVYDILFLAGNDLRDQPFAERRAALTAWHTKQSMPQLHVSPLLHFNDWPALQQHYTIGVQDSGYEGVMLKRKDSRYQAGRPAGQWLKWKRAPQCVDAILMYAARGHGKRSGWYTDYTFGVWLGEGLVPIGKAYSGLTDAELRTLDRWIRQHTVQRFGPVREVEKVLVLEVAFDSAQLSARHKSGLALRFPRILRIRIDKPASEVTNLATLWNTLGLPSHC